MRYFWLNFHVNYACRHSGACCSAGWPIPVEKTRTVQIQQLSNHADWLVPAVPPQRGSRAGGPVGAPDDVVGTLALHPGGHCVFHGDGGCHVYPARPSSCSHFPYVCVIDQRGVHVALSHYCPTAAALLFDPGGPIEIVEGPAPPTGLDVPEGLDAREALPPLASPSLDFPGHLRHLRLMSFDEFTRWEKNTVRTVGAHLAPHVTWPEAPQHLEDICGSFVSPAWPAFEPVIARYLAAKAFASWAAYLNDDGIAAVLRGVERARAVLQVEAARQCALADRRLDAALLREAIRHSDLLLVHSADSRVLSSAKQI